MSRQLTPATDSTIRTIERALTDIRSARANLRAAGAVQAARYVGKAIKSVEGALRHAYRREQAAHYIAAQCGCEHPYQACGECMP